MKKILLLLALCATVFVACSDDDDKDDNGNKQKLVSKIVADYGVGETCTTTFEYNSEGKITKVVNTYKGGYDDGHIVTRTFKKEGTKLTAIYSNNYSSKGEKIFECELNDKGFIIKGKCEGSCDFKNITYNEKGQLIQIDDDFTFEWLNDNIISLDNYGITNYTYTEYENKTNYDFGWQLISIWEYDMYETSYFGVKSKNLIAKEERISGTPERRTNYTYEYTFDKEGYVTSAKQYEIKDGQKKLVNTQNITYKE